MNVPPPFPLAAPARLSALAVWSLVLGILGVFLCLPSVAGLICGCMALMHINRSGGALRGSGLAIGGIVVCVGGPFVTAILAAVVIPVVASISEEKMTLPQARQGFVTHLTRQEQTGAPVDPPPNATIRLVKYRAPLGEYPAYLSAIPNDGRKHPAIVWLVGGFSNSIGGEVWENAPADNDQTARVFRENGVVTLYPSLRGGNQNAGYRETFFGEVDDVLAATDFLAAQRGIDPQRIFLGGHSTGGTLALLVAESTSRYRAVFSFGPVANIRGYGDDEMTFDVKNSKESRLRDPVRWLRSITSPTFVFEGAGESSNIASLHALQAKSKNELLRFYPMPGGTHFSILQPLSKQIAAQISADLATERKFELQPLDWE
jgi:acetyl esterase/lipase